jgi:hypothetical protein
MEWVVVLVGRKQAPGEVSSEHYGDKGRDTEGTRRHVVAIMPLSGLA